ncbi:glycosyltransferase [Zunongwangia sp. F260]|uniref:Glycosyltransferase n=1 Tax=Autumnicola lenta TaxID=3075593 RepID=A0ABU3CM62_9FLAO|nr:glycosyltransferase [Zunongwangia sp. F260]MDT0647437.1 glycosyltransferase [Zunongwangia sp. F260]
MISIVVCHRDTQLLQNFKKNVEETIGIPFEFVIIDNKANDYNIFQAYNLGIERSKFDIVCFSHEDIIYHTADWGKKVVVHFKDERTGMIGIIGGNVFPNCPSPWWNSSYLNDHLINNIQHWKEGFEPKNDPNKKPFQGKDNVTVDYHNPTKEHKVKAVALDGLWMCAHKRALKNCSFDEETFNGFHCYDTDICLQVGQTHEIYVIYDILMEHLSMGTVAKDWAESAELLADKWKHRLPVFAKEVEQDKIPRYNNECLLTYCYWIKGMGLSDQKIRSIILKYLEPKNKFVSQEGLLLWLWSKLGYQNARFPYRVLKPLI